jgi:RNA polymerase sigma factor (sigma-70 family)
MTQTLTNTLLYERILEEVQHLPPKQGNIFCLRYIEELSNKEIAELCDIDQKTVSSVLSMVSKKIKEKVGVGG